MQNIIKIPPLFTIKKSSFIQYVTANLTAGWCSFLHVKTPVVIGNLATIMPCLNKRTTNNNTAIITCDEGQTRLNSAFLSESDTSERYPVYISHLFFFLTASAKQCYTRNYHYCAFSGRNSSCRGKNKKK